MKNKELQTLLAQYPDDMPIKLMNDHVSMQVMDLTEENILHTSESVRINDDAPVCEWDTEDGKIELGEGQQYLLFNPMIF